MSELAANQAGYWEAVIASISDSVVITDEHGHCIYANQAGLDLAGAASVQDLRSRSRRSGPRSVMSAISQRISGPTFGTLDYLSFIAFRGERGRNIPVRFTNYRGEEKETLVSFARVVGSDDSPVRYVFVSRDVTDLKRHEKMRQELLQTVSHELRNPLQVMKGLVQLSRIKTNMDMDELHRYIDSLDRQVNHVASLVDGVLTAYQVGEDRLSLNFQASNLIDLARQAMKSYLHTTDRRVSLTEDARVIPVNADTARLTQVISNLLSNAWKFTSPGGEISMHVGVEQEAACVSVEDDGEGIPAGELERVFDGFYRSVDVADWKSGGIGLGLYIGRNILRRHGGDLWAEHRPQGGTTMRMRLPLHGQLTLPTTAD